MNIFTPEIVTEIQNFQKNPTQKRFFEIMILRKNFAGQIDAILKQFPNTENPFLEKFLSENPDMQEKSAILHAAQKISETQPHFFEKILRDTRELH
ncbi:MAG: hypothetical protein ACTTH6_04335 [Candidatus Altimarinota bacterium]